jgi:hypothetical protein
MRSRTRISVILIVLLLIGFSFFILNYFWTDYVSREGFNTENNTYEYFPKKINNNTKLKISFTINDFIRDAIEVPESIKTYKKLAHVPDKNSSVAGTLTSTGEYSIPIENTELYKKYHNDIKPGETKTLDKTYGDLFDTTKISSLELNDIQKLVREKMAIENRRYNLVKYFLNKNPETTYSLYEFADYFATLINAYKSQSGQLDSIKTFLYKIIGPITTHADLIDHYKTNKSLYSKKDDVLFILNTTKEFLEKVKIEELDHNTYKNVFIFKDDATNFNSKTFSVDSLTVFVLGSILMNIHPLLEGKNSLHISMSNAEFATMFELYIQKKFPQAKTKSVIAFAVNPQNTPDLPDSKPST